jgi:hypothetical protein
VSASGKSPALGAPVYARPMQGKVLKIVSASTGPDNVTSVVHEEASPEQALKTALFALTGHDELHPATPENVIVGVVTVNEPDRIVIHHAHPTSGGGWDYEFRGTESELELLHRAVAGFEQAVSRARERGAAEAVLAWHPSAEELQAADFGPALSSLER